jgi:excisionase family DNA binding protein
MSGRALTVAEVADYFGVGPATVVSWIRSGELRATNVSRSPGGPKPRYRIAPSALTSFEQSRAPTPPATRQRRRRPSPADVVVFYP